MEKVEIYTRPNCGYCMRARIFLKKNNISFTEYDSGEQPEYRAEMITRSGRETFPQIFINKKYVGGWDDLNALNQEGGLEALLAG